MIIDKDLHLLTTWEKKVGADIGGPVPFVPPDLYGIIQHPDAMQLYISGKPYTDWLAALHRPVLSTAGTFSLAFDIQTDSFAPAAAQAIEFDVRLSIGGWNYNLSTQVNYARSGLLQVSGPLGQWMDTPHVIGKFTPGVWYPVLVNYQFDPAAHTYSNTEVRIGPKRCTAISHTQSAQSLGWSDGAHLQLQQDLSSAGGSYAVYFRKLQLQWE